MNDLYQRLANGICNEMKDVNPKWKNYFYRLSALSAPTPGFSIEAKELSDDVLNKEYVPVRLREFSDLKFDLFIIANQSEKVNVIEFIFTDNILNSVNKSWDQSLKDRFEELLPKAKKGKVKVWYEPGSEYLVGKQAKTIAETPALSMFDTLFNRLPSTEPELNDLIELSLSELYSLVITYVSDADNPLWDGGIVVLKKMNGQYNGELLANYAQTEEDRVNGYAVTEQRPFKVVTERMRSIYDALQARTKLEYPGIVWDSVFISVYRDGFTEANFELDGEEVDLS